MSKMYEEHKSGKKKSKCDFGKCGSIVNNTSDINIPKNNEGNVSKIFRNISLFVLAAALFLFIMLTAVSPAFALQDLMALQGNAYNGTIPINGSVRITIWNQSVGGSLIYDSSSDYDSAVTNGKFDIMLGDGSQVLTLDYGKIYYMDMSISGQDLDFNGSERRIFQSNSGSVSGTLITSQNLMNVNSSINAQYIDGISASVLLNNDTALNNRIETLNLTKATGGTCPQGQFVQNTTSGGVQCATPSSAIGNPFNQNLNTTDNVQFRNITATNVSAANIFGALNWTYIVSIPAYVKDYSGDINAKLSLSDQRFNESALIGGKLDSSDQRFNETSRLDLLNSTKLNIADQRFNDSLINSTTNIQSLGFNTTTQLKTYFDTLYTTISSVVSIVGNWSAERTGVLSNITSINTTATAANALATTANITATQANTTATTHTTLISGIQSNISSLGNWTMDKSNVLANISSLYSWNNTQATNIANLQTSNTTIYARVDLLNTTKGNASTGNCAVGMVVQNVTASGVQCITPVASASAGGSNTTIQYNADGTIGGATYGRIDNGYLNTGATTTVPPAPSSGITIAGKVRAAETVLMYEGPAGLEKTVQPMIGEEDAIWCNPAHGTATTTIHTCTAGYVAAIGTVSNPATNYSSVRSSMVWNVLTSAAGYTEHKGLGLKWGRGNASLPAQNGGFKLMQTFYVGTLDANTVGCFGMMDEVTAYTNVTNCFLGTANKNSIFTGFDKGQTTLRIFVANATSAVPYQVMDCGNDFNITTTNNHVFRQTIFAKPNGGSVSIFIQRVDNSSITPCEYTFTGNEVALPISTVPLSWRMFMGRSAAPPGTTGITMGMNKVYLSTDN